MFSIEQSVKECMWPEAAEACASAMSRLTKDEQLSIAQTFLEQADIHIKEAHQGRWFVNGGRIPPLPSNNSSELPPWSVHIADARDELKTLNTDDIPMDKFSAQIAAILWDAVFGLQVAAWAAGDPEDYRLWTKGEGSGSVLDSDYANAVGVTHWLEIDRVIKESSEFRGQKDTDIYQVRPAIFALRELASNDET